MFCKIMSDTIALALGMHEKISNNFISYTWKLLTYILHLGIDYQTEQKYSSVDSIISMISSEPPSSTTLSTPTSKENLRARTTAIASTLATECGRGKFRDVDVITKPFSSLITTHILARPSALKTVPSKLILKQSTRRNFQVARGHGRTGVWAPLRLWNWW